MKVFCSSIEELETLLNRWKNKEDLSDMEISDNPGVVTNQQNKQVTQPTSEDTLKTKNFGGQNFGGKNFGGKNFAELFRISAEKFSAMKNFGGEKFRRVFSPKFFAAEIFGIVTFSSIPKIQFLKKIFLKNNLWSCSPKNAKFEPSFKFYSYLN